MICVHAISIVWVIIVARLICITKLLQVDLTAYVEKHEFVFDAVLDEEVSNDEVMFQSTQDRSLLWRSFILQISGSCCGAYFSSYYVTFCRFIVRQWSLLSPLFFSASKPLALHMGRQVNSLQWNIIDRYTRSFSRKNWQANISKTLGPNI